ncbi:MAG: toll/interleukin-1 receptor domain-containing protein [Clostridia bacterium]|nr:toll/interleukin-1 receptor domain-containing protein [Clostridia bacterium]
MKDYEILLKKLISKANKDDLNILCYTIESGERPLFGKLEMDGYIKNVHFRGHQYVGLDLTYEGLHYFDKKSDAVPEKTDPKPRKMYDVFLSHASADKIAYVEDLKKSLEILGIEIFYDKDTIEWGDNWKAKIYEGLEKSEFAIIVISENFFGREWTELELKTLLERQNDEGQKLILPILHNITTEQLRDKYPTVADIQAIESGKNSTEQIVLLFAKQLIKRYK